MKVECSNCGNTEHPQGSTYCMICGEKLESIKSEVFTIDFGAVNLKSLILTNDVVHYEKMKARNNIGVLFEPIVLEHFNVEPNVPIYLIGIHADKEVQDQDSTLN